MPKSSKKKPFVHLHNHSDYSLLDGATSVRRMAELAAKFDSPAVALTDHGNMFGAVEFYGAVREKGIKPVLGCELYIAKESRLKKEAKPGQRHYNHLTVLAEDEAGYRNLIHLVSKGYLEGFYYRPRVDKELLKEHAKGLIALSGCMSGEVAEYVLRNDVQGAENTALEFREILGKENFYLELQDQGIPEQRRLNDVAKHIAKKHQMPLVATNDCHFPEASDYESHQVLLAIQTGRTLQEDQPLKYSKGHYFRPPAEMWEKFSDTPEALENTLQIADRCHFGFEEEKLLLPHFDIPEGETPQDYFRRVVREGMERRMPRLRALQEKGALRRPLKAYEERLDHEMDVLVKMGFPGYFLIVWDFIRYAKEHEIPVGPGRGSVGGSLVAYALGITGLDPLEHDLVFERFINPERKSPPDIDIDFCERRRSEVIEYVTKKYGRENVAQVITFGTMKARAVVRDVGRVLGFPYGETDRLAKMIPYELGMTLRTAARVAPELRKEIEERSDVKRLWEHSLKLEGLVRHASIHAAGVVVTPRPVWEYVPLYRSDRDEVTTQYAKEGIERVGLLKMDFLGLRTLTALDDTLRSLREKKGIELALEDLPLDDRETYELFTRGDTYGVFQFESSGMREILRRLKPDRLDDLIALNALYRPGPLQGGVIDDFVKRRHGRAEVSYMIPQLEPILKDTYGIIVYQEQVMRIAMDVAGYRPGAADILRRAMGKKRKDVMAKERKRFVDGAVSRGVKSGRAQELFDLMEKFAGYGFNKSHSAAYALIAYWTGYLKAHHPVHFMASVLTSYRGDAKHIVEAVYECRERGIEVVPPDVNRSELNFAVDGKKILFGLSAVKNVGEKAVDGILDVRRKSGRIDSFFGLASEVDSRLCNRKVWESLVKAGAFDSLGRKRAQLFAVLDEAIARSQAAARNGFRGMGSLFEGDSQNEDERRIPDIEEASKGELLAGEREVLGFYIEGNPLDDFREEIERFATADSKTLAERPDRSEQALAGIVRKVSAKTTRRGDLMARLELEDRRGSIEVLVFPETYRRSRDLLEEENIIFIKGAADVVTEGREAKLLAEEIRPLQSLRRPAAASGRSVLIETSAIGFEDEMLAQLEQLLQKHRGDKPVYLHLHYPRRFAVKIQLSPEQCVAPTPAFLQAVKELLGEESVKLEV